MGPIEGTNFTPVTEQTLLPAQPVCQQSRGQGEVSRGRGGLQDSCAGPRSNPGKAAVGDPWVRERNGTSDRLLNPSGELRLREGQRLLMMAPGAGSGEGASASRSPPPPLTDTPSEPAARGSQESTLGPQTSTEPGSCSLRGGRRGAAPTRRFWGGLGPRQSGKAAWRWDSWPRGEGHTGRGTACAKVACSTRTRHVRGQRAVSVTQRLSGGPQRNGKVGAN